MAIFNSYVTNYKRVFEATQHGHFPTVTVTKIVPVRFPAREFTTRPRQCDDVGLPHRAHGRRLCPGLDGAVVMGCDGRGKAWL